MKIYLSLAVFCVTVCGGYDSFAMEASAVRATTASSAATAHFPASAPISIVNKQTPVVTLEPRVKQSPPPTTSTHRSSSHRSSSAPTISTERPLVSRKHPSKRSVHHVVKQQSASKPRPPTARRSALRRSIDSDSSVNVELAQVRSVVHSILTANAQHINSRSSAISKQVAAQQAPRATVLTCADSHSQRDIQSVDSMDDLFVVRDIGNQLATVQGSIEYGIRHLHTPLLMIIGHSACHAIVAATSDYSSLEPAIRKELATINLPKGLDPTDGALLNVNNQVEGAILNFSGEVERGKLAIIGAFYDLRNDLHQGYGKLIITNINGETKPEKIQQLIKTGQFFKESFVE